jgi:hypothetical protein
MDVSKLQRGERMAMFSGIALFLIMILFPWFGVDIPAEVRGLAEMSGQDFRFNAFEAFEVIDLILFVTVVVVVGLAFATATGRKIRLPVSASALTAALGILSTFLIFYRILDVPGPGGGMGIERKLGVFLGLIAAAGIAYGGWISMKSEGVTFAEAAEDLQDRFAPEDTDEGTPTESG